MGWIPGDACVGHFHRWGQIALRGGCSDCHCHRAEQDREGGTSWLPPLDGEEESLPVDRSGMASERPSLRRNFGVVEDECGEKTN